MKQNDGRARAGNGLISGGFAATAFFLNGSYKAAISPILLNLVPACSVCVHNKWLGSNSYWRSFDKKLIPAQPLGNKSLKSKPMFLKG